MSTPQMNPDFITALEPLGQGAADFLLAAALYHAHKISFAAATALAGLASREFRDRLKEPFGHGMIIDDETVREDVRPVDDMRVLNLLCKGLDQE